MFYINLSYYLTLFYFVLLYSYRVVGGTPSFIVLAAGSKFNKSFTSKYKVKNYLFFIYHLIPNAVTFFSISL